MSSYTIPNVIAQHPRGERIMDVYSHLLTERIVYLGTPIDSGVANTLIAQLLHLEADSAEEINLYINCEGGDLPPMLAEYSLGVPGYLAVRWTCRCGTLVPDHGCMHMLGPGDLAQRPAGARAPPAHGSPRGQLDHPGRTRAAKARRKMSEIDGTAGATGRQVRDDDQVILTDWAAGHQRSSCPVLMADEALRRRILRDHGQNRGTNSAAG